MEARKVVPINGSRHSQVQDRYRMIYRHYISWWMVDTRGSSSRDGEIAYGLYGRFSMRDSSSGCFFVVSLLLLCCFFVISDFFVFIEAE